MLPESLSKRLWLNYLYNRLFLNYFVRIKYFWISTWVVSRRFIDMCWRLLDPLKCPLANRLPVSSVILVHRYNNLMDSLNSSLSSSISHVRLFSPADTPTPEAIRTRLCTRMRLTIIFLRNLLHSGMYASKDIFRYHTEQYVTFVWKIICGERWST